MMGSKLTFVVMAYKDSPFLGECLDSLVAQTEKSSIVIATSTPSQYIDKMAKKYGVEVKVNEPGKGIAADWNFSLRAASTKYVTLAHQDDIYMPDYAKLCLKSAEKYDDAIITFTDYVELVGGKDRANSPVMLIKKLENFVFLTLTRSLKARFWRSLFISVSSPICCPSVMYNMEKLADFEFTRDFSINMDWDAWYRMLEIKGRYVRVPSVLMKHRIHADSETTHGLQENKRQTEDLLMFKRFWPGFIAKLLAKFYALGYKSNG